MANRRLLKIYGERNTDANCLGKLIELNLVVEQLLRQISDAIACE